MATSALSPTNTTIPKTTPAGIAALDAASNPATSSLERTNSKDSKATSAGLKLADDFNSFLKLLTTQLQNQDPTEPLDTNQFTQQLVAFSGVEQSVATNKNLESLISLVQGSKISDAVGYIGKVVDTEGTQLALKDKASVFNVDVPQGATSVTVGIMDSAGKVIYSSTDNKVGAGSQDFFWDGKNSFTKTQMPDGLYTFGVVAKDAKGKVLESKTYTSGKVVSVADDGTDTIFALSNGLKVPLAKVTAIREAPSVVAPSTTTTTTNASNNTTNTNNTGNPA